MSAPLDRLAAALADRYRIERELGAGGMATVYLAHDLKHDRELAAINAIEGHTDSALAWLDRGYRAGWKDARFLSLDPFFASVRREPRYLALTTAMTQDVAEMRKRAAAAHPSLFTPRE